MVQAIVRPSERVWSGHPSHYVIWNTVTSDNSEPISVEVLGLSMDKEHKVWIVYIPHKLLDQSSSFLHGVVDSTNHAIVITISTESAGTANWLTQQGLSTIGTWNDSEQDRISHKSGHNHWASLYLDEDKDLQCSVIVNNSKVLSTVVIFDAKLLQKSVLLQEKCNKGLADNVTLIYQALHNSVQNLSGFEKQDDLKCYAIQRDKQSSTLTRVMATLPYMIALLYFPFWWIKAKQRQERKTLLQKVFTTPSTVKQLGYRVTDLRHVTSTYPQRTFNGLRAADTCLRQILDSVLGLFVMYILMQEGMADYIGNMVLTYGDIVAGELKTLLHWLKGAPAGLKLNSQLSNMLAQFFQYHIYLWTGYLYLLKPILGTLIYYSLVTGIWGLTVQLSLYQDIFSTLTLHIYCFYVYAARLYCLQLYALSSFWRLFRGKKWNVLRQRVDSAVYDIDQLFLGTLLFTVLLFLLPTTMIYYVVFTLLRLLVLMIQLVVGKVRHVLNTMPVWSILLWISRSPKLTDGAIFHVINSKSCKKDYSCLIVSMQMNRIDLQSVLSLTKHQLSPQDGSRKWLTLCRNVFYGELIFPWIEKKKNHV